MAVNGNDRIVWIDCEMTGLDLEVDELVEIAIVVTDFDLNVLDPGFEIVIRPDDSALAHMGEFVTKMHETSGLLEEIPNGVSVAEAEFEELVLHLLFGLDVVGVLLAADNAEQRRLGDVDVPLRHEVVHLAIEEGEQQRANV